MLTIEYLNESFIRAYSDSVAIEQELADRYTFDYPGAKYTPQFKAKIWDGKVRLYNTQEKTIFKGLRDHIVQWTTENNIPVQYVNYTKQSIPDSKLIIDFLDSIHSNPPLRAYQLNAIIYAILNKRTVIVSPTGSGKSLIIYLLIQWYLAQNMKIMLVIPTTSLVVQMYHDFEEYSKSNNSNCIIIDQCQKLYSGFSKVLEKNVLITTWQSVYKQPAIWFNQFDVIIGDESHTFKASSLQSLMNKMTKTSIRIGTTGSLDNKKINNLVLEGLFGPIYKVTTTKSLQDSGQLAKLNITQLHLKYSPPAIPIKTIQQELKYLATNNQRNKFICNLALSLTGNTLILFQLVENHGIPLYNNLLEKTQQKVYCIHGGIEAQEREDIRNILIKETNSILVASYGSMSTGINIPSLQNIIFASPTKSIIRVLQSIGRGLRLAENKTLCTLYDIADNLQVDNLSYKHAQDRLEIYQKEQFPFKIVNINIR